MGIAAAYKMKQVGYQDYLVLKRQRELVVHGVIIITPAVAVMYLRHCIHFPLHLVINGAIYLPKQPEILSYLEWVVEQFNCKTKSASA